MMESLFSWGLGRAWISSGTIQRTFTTKLYRGRLSHWKFGVCEFQGFQSQMEDTHIAAEISDTAVLFGVFDGHNGAFVSNFLKTSILSLFLSSDAYIAKDYATALKTAFISADEVLRHQKQDLSLTGATGTLLYLSGNNLYVANLGLCKAIVSHNHRPVLLTHDHFSIDPDERKRIEAAGGFVCSESRRINRLHFDFSRSIGDFALKNRNEKSQGEQIMSPVASTFSYELTPADDFLLVGTAGLWEGRTVEELNILVNKSWDKTSDLSKMASDVCNRLTRCCTKNEFVYLPSTAGAENMTCLLVTRT